jgi:hypothetical protein
MSDQKNFKPTKWQLDFYKSVIEAKGPIKFIAPRSAGLTTILRWMEQNDPESYNKYLELFRV